MPSPTQDVNPTISVIIAARNEENAIARRIQNIIGQDGVAQVEVVLGSDGSIDKTVSQAKSLNYGKLTILDFPESRGRAVTHNDCVNAACGEILVFTDADTEFVPNFLQKIQQAFLDPTIGFVVGHLRWRNANDSTLSSNNSIYLQYESSLRAMESDLGLLATGSGPCIAVRRQLFKPLNPDEDVDFITPLDVVMQGYRVVYAPDAIVFDIAQESAKGEITVRRRMTAKNLVGTLRKLRTISICSHPGVWISIISHKILRWCVPVFIILAFICNILLLHSGMTYFVLFLAQVFAYMLAIVGWCAEEVGARIPVINSLYSFAVTNLGMLLGVLDALRGVRIHVYDKPER